MTKLNKEQLKKLYDYGGTLNPRDWANMIDSVVPPSDGKYTIVKTTYESARDLYYKGQMEYGVKYKFDHIHHNCSADSALYMPNLQVYIDNNGNLKANYIAPDVENISYIDIESIYYPGESVQIPSYDRSFTSDFRFDYFITTALSDSFEGIYFYEINNKKTITLDYDWDNVDEQYVNNFINQLNSLGIAHTYEYHINDEYYSSMIITFEDCNQIHVSPFDDDSYYDIILYEKYAILINASSDVPDFTILEIDLLHLPLIENIEYDTGCFHKILVDANMIYEGGSYYTVSLYGDICKIPTDDHIRGYSETMGEALQFIDDRYVIYNMSINTFLNYIDRLYNEGSEDELVNHTLLCINTHSTTLTDVYEM